ncbi:hypothetical protein [Pseudanabaena sp. 'Roaring Creek']|uniref:hypothetical protein n=1 Tax=Pseudanabaena sp. 'Roaring Creek' TaxID=1681830 RepID=UPI0006D7E3BF|nr:hypothetical protein [Pseudanabaena sp. 'Roaring Creek']
MLIIKFKNSLLILLLLLQSCNSKASNPTTNSIHVPQVSAPKIPESITKPTVKPLPQTNKIYPWDFQVGLEKIDPNLLGEGSKLQISYIKESETSPKGHCYYEANYPQISGLKDIKLQEEINYKLWVLITKQAYGSFQNGLNNQSSICSRSEELGADSPYRRVTSTIERCRVTFARGALVSLVCEEWHAPGAYPLIYQRGATFNLETGKMYLIDDLWKSDVNYESDIEPFIYTIKTLKDIDGTEIVNISAAPGKARFGQLKTNGDFYLADQCENRENTLPPFITPPDLSKMTCIIFVKTGSGMERNLNLSITTAEIAKFLNAEIDEIANTKQFSELLKRD